MAERYHLKPAHQRVLALLLLIGLFGTLAAAIAVPTWLLHRHYDSHIENISDKLARYDRINQLRPAIDAKADSIRKENAKRLYLKTNVPPLAAAELQGAITKIIESSGAKIVSTQVVPARDEDKMRRVSIQLTFNGSIHAIQRSLHAIENNEQPLLFIDSMTIRAMQGRAYRPLPGIQPEFSVQLGVCGYALSSPA